MNKRNSLSLFFLFSFILTLCLGTWQLHRLKWKNDLINNIETSINSPSTFENDYNYLELTSVLITDDYYFSKKPVFMESKTHNGKSGYHVYLPIFKDNTLMSVLNIGWMPKKNIGDLNDIYESMLNKKTLNVYIRDFYIKKPYFTPVNDLKTNIWFYPDKKNLSTFYADDIRLNQYFVLAESSINKYFVNQRVLIRNSHLQYLLTWYLLSLTSLIMLIITRKKY